MEPSICSEYVHMHLHGTVPLWWKVHKCVFAPHPYSCDVGSSWCSGEGFSLSPLARRPSEQLYNQLRSHCRLQSMCIATNVSIYLLCCLEPGANTHDCSCREKRSSPADRASGTMQTGSSGILGSEHPPWACGAAKQVWALGWSRQGTCSEPSH